jgi:hypothetical protein
VLGDPGNENHGQFSHLITPPFSLTKKGKKIEIHPPTTITNYRLPKTEVEWLEKEKRGLEGEYTQQQKNPKTLSTRGTSPSSHPAAAAKPNQYIQ